MYLGFTMKTDSLWRPWFVSTEGGHSMEHCFVQTFTL